MTIRRFAHSVGFVLAIAATVACGSNSDAGKEDAQTEITAGSTSTPSFGGAGSGAGRQSATAGAPQTAGQAGTPGTTIAGSPAVGGATGGVGPSGSGGAGRAAQGGGGAPRGGAAASSTMGGGVTSAGGGSAAAAAGVGAGGGAAGSGGGTCEKGQVKGNEVLWIGDSWIQIPGNQYTGVRDLARQAGALGASENYVNRAVSGSPIGTIISQYTTYQSGSTKAKVLVMDGGGIDVMQGGKTQASVDGVITKVKDHFAKVASDGTVKHIVYYLYPQLPASGPGADVGPKLEPGIEAACAASSVPCHFLYLEPLFTGHADYVGGDSLHPSQSGAGVIANAIWEIMQKNCIAQ